MDEAPYIPLYTYRKYRIVNVQTFTFNVYMLLSCGLIATTDTRKSKKNTYKNECRFFKFVFKKIITQKFNQKRNKTYNSKIKNLLKLLA